MLGQKRTGTGVMARSINKLSARAVETLKAPGRYSDGGNLYLSISDNGGRRWVFMYRFAGKQREMGLGSASRAGTSLARARDLAAEARIALAAGLDPLEMRRAARQAERTLPTFAECADAFIETHRSSWRNDKHIAQWIVTLSTHCAPIRGMPIDKIDTEAVLKVLQPIWERLPETAKRLRGRLEKVLDAAAVRGFRTGENPARWRGHLQNLLAKPKTLSRGHHAALPYEQVPEFMAQLRVRQSLAARALEFVILTACRSGEVRGARWDEIDLGKTVWVIPADRMKAGKEHRVPLSDRATNLLTSLRETRTSDFVFPGTTPGKPLSGMAMAMQLRRMKRDAITVHGFRSTFRDWASETTSFPHEVCEQALAHAIGNKTEAAYRRGDLFDKRRKLMEAWAQFCEQPKEAKVITLTRPS
jgi:integrase